VTWISTKERLPDEGKTVLIVRSSPKETITDVGYLYKNLWLVEEYGCIDEPESVTHWMPLPDPPNPPTGG
jgi:hypothetical protein